MLSGPKRYGRRRRIILGTALLFCFLCGLSAAMGQTVQSAFLEDGLVVDNSGRRIDVGRPFKRIISLYGAHTENLFQLGLEREIVGVGRFDTYPPAAAGKTVFSYHDDPEKYLAARPDLVLVRPMIDRGYPALIRRLEKWGITVVSLQPGTVDEMLVYWEILGALTGREAAAQEMIAGFRKTVHACRQVTEGILEKKKVYFESIHDKMKTFSPDAIAIFALETAGGINVAADAVPSRGSNIANYGKEKLLSRGKEIDVFLAQEGAMNRPSVTLIRDESGFGLIKAVTDGEIYVIDEMIVSRPTLRLLTGIYTIGRILYPQQFTEQFIRMLQQQG